MTEYEDKLSRSLFLCVEQNISANKVLKLFAKSGWSWRNCAWDEYEVTFEDIAELVVTSTNPVLISGGLAKGNLAIDAIQSVLNDGGIGYSFELFDEHDNLLQSRD